MEQYRALCPTHPSNLREAIRSGKYLLGVGVTFPSVEVAKKIALTGYDWAFIDCEHATFTLPLLAEIIQNIALHSGGKTVSVVRVPAGEPSWITAAIDAGASGIILPHTETKEQVEELISHSRFPPEGHRSYPPWSWVPGFQDMTKTGETIFELSNRSIAIIPQIESRKGIETMEDIISMPGVDTVMIGPADLRLDLGLPFGIVGSEPEFVAAVERATALSRKYNKSLLGIAPPEMAEVFQHKLENNYKMLCVAVDLTTFLYGLAGSAAGARAAIEQASKEAAEPKRMVNGNPGQGLPN